MLAILGVADAGQACEEGLAMKDAKCATRAVKVDTPLQRTARRSSILILRC